MKQRLSFQSSQGTQIRRSVRMNVFRQLTVVMTAMVMVYSAVTNSFATGCVPSRPAAKNLILPDDAQAPNEAIYIRDPVKVAYVQKPAVALYIQAPVKVVYIQAPIKSVYIKAPVKVVYIQAPVVDFYVQAAIKVLYKQAAVESFYNQGPIKYFYDQGPSGTAYYPPIAAQGQLPAQDGDL